MTKQTEQGAAGFSLLPVDDMENWLEGGRWNTSIVLRLLEEYAIANMMADRLQRAKNLTPEGCALGDIWDRPGPQIVAAEHGPEPTLREVIRSYYTGHGTSKADAERFTDQYIAAATSHPTPKE